MWILAVLFHSIHAQTCSANGNSCMERSFIALKPDTLQVQIYWGSNSPLFDTWSSFIWLARAGRRHYKSIRAKRFSTSWTQARPAFSRTCREALRGTSWKAVLRRTCKLHDFWSNCRFCLAGKEHYFKVSPCCLQLIAGSIKMSNKRNCFVCILSVRRISRSPFYSRFTLVCKPPPFFL